MAGRYARKKLTSSRDTTRVLLSRRQRAVERSEREPRRSTTPEACLGCGGDVTAAALCLDCSDVRDRSVA